DLDAAQIRTGGPGRRYSPARILVGHGVPVDPDDVLRVHAAKGIEDDLGARDSPGQPRGMHAPTVSTELLDEAPHLRAVSVDGEQRPVAEPPEVVPVPEVPRIAEDRDDQRVVVRALLPEADDATPTRSEV